MKHRLYTFFMRIAAVLLAFLTSALNGQPPTPVRPDAHTVTAHDVQSADYALSVDAADRVNAISDRLFGVFFEDINFAADGGLYAELVANRSFEFTELALGDGLYGWRTIGGATATLSTDDALNANNPTHLELRNPTLRPAGIANRGFMEGMALREGAVYNGSLYAKGLDGYRGGLTLRLCVNGEAVATTAVDALTDTWEKYSFTLSCAVTATAGVSLQVLLDRGGAALDMVSLFPADTFRGRENGLRRDLAEMVAALEPKFLRFPGGCVIEGYDADTAYSWKDSVGADSNGEPLLFAGGYGDTAARKQGVNLWTDLAAADDPYPCFMSYGLGFYEFFQFAEDIGAVGVPVLNCGLYCQMRGRGGVDMDGDLFQRYIRDMLDLVEFCRGGTDTKWGAVRAAMGHAQPFALEYICIGNENEGTDYYERYRRFLDAFNAAKTQNPTLYAGIELVYSAGASDATHGGQYLASYEYAKAQLGGSADVAAFAGATDQHYYNEPSWFLRNTDYYDADNYRRTVDGMTDTLYGGAIPVFLGEYAARSNTLGAALAEAAYMTGLERNGDIVRMAAYAPLFGNLTAGHWTPNLIWFNNSRCIGSVNYYIQKLFSVNAGTELLASSLEGAQVEQAPLTGRTGVGTWYTAAEFDNVRIVDNATGELLDGDDFTVNTFLWNWEAATDGDFKVRGGKLRQTSTDMAYSETGSVAYFGCGDRTDYTYTVEATKTDGAEGFLIPFAVQDAQNNCFWNLGGWDNTVSCLQRIENGVKTGQIIGTVKPFTVETGRTYRLSVCVSGTRVVCKVDDEVYVDYDFGSDCEAEAYHVVSTDETGDIILKLVNVTDSDRVFAVDTAGVSVAPTATVSCVAGDSPADENTPLTPQGCVLEEFTIDGVSARFNYTVPAYSVTVLRLHTR